MADRLTLGPVSVFDNGVLSINMALTEIQNRIDAIKGLRGRTELWDRTRVDDPTQAQDALTLGSVTGDETLFRVPYLTSPVGLAATPGTSYAEMAEMVRQAIDFSRQTVSFIRLVIAGWATDGGSHSVAVTDASGAVLAEVSWSGNTEDVREGSWTALDLAVDTVTRLYAKGADSLDTIVLRSAVLECRATINTMV